MPPNGSNLTLDGSRTTGNPWAVPAAATMAAFAAPGSSRVGVVPSRSTARGGAGIAQRATGGVRRPVQLQTGRVRSEGRGGLRQRASATRRARHTGRSVAARPEPSAPAAAAVSQADSVRAPLSDIGRLPRATVLLPPLSFCFGVKTCLSTPARSRSALRRTTAVACPNVWCEPYSSCDEARLRRAASSQELTSQTGADASLPLLEGSVRKLDDRIWIIARLIDSGSGEHIWAGGLAPSTVQWYAGS